MDEELIARLYPEHGDQWLNAQMEIGDKCNPQGVNTGTDAHNTGTEAAYFFCLSPFLQLLKNTCHCCYESAMEKNKIK